MKTASISGFGGSYEWGCQRMLQLGIEFLKANPSFSFDGYKSYKNIYGIMAEEPPEGKLLDEAMMSDPMLKEFGVTGAMHQAVLGHLCYIHTNSYDKWISELSKHRKPEEIFDFDGSMESVPHTEFSRKMEKEKNEQPS